MITFYSVHILRCCIDTFLFSQLSKVKSPKEDLAKELRNVKKESRDIVDETIRQEEAELSATEDGTVPMPTEEEAAVPQESVVTFAETTTELEPEDAVVKKLKRKKEKVEEEEGIYQWCFFFQIIHSSLMLNNWIVYFKSLQHKQF